MDSLWPEKIEENAFDVPRALLVRQGEFLKQMTGDIVYATVEEIGFAECPSQLRDDFMFRFTIRATALEKYRYPVLMFSHGISFYPVSFILNDDILKELGKKDVIIKVTTPQEYETLVRRILNTDKLRQVIGSIIKLSK